MRIGFLTTVGVNVGDDFIRAGIRAILDRLSIAYEPLYVNKHDQQSLYQPIGDERTAVWDKYWDCDLFIQSGAPVYWYLRGGASSSLNSDWYPWMWRDRILSMDPYRPGPPFVNLGAGSGQKLGDDAAAFLADPECAAFARSAAERASLTTVRDPIASEILLQTGSRFEALPCPAFLASSRYAMPTAAATHIGVNLMRIGGHYQLNETFDQSKWHGDCERLVTFMRSLGPLHFIAHNADERAFMSRFAQPGEVVFLSDSWHAYLEVYSACRVVLANRVHGAICAAGYGVPSVIIGNDSRIWIGEYIGAPHFEVEALLDPVLSAIETAYRARDEQSERLRALRDTTMDRYAELLGPILEKASASASVPLRNLWHHGPLPRTTCRAAITAELPTTAIANHEFIVNCELTNEGDVALTGAMPNPVQFCYRWFDMDGQPVGAGSWLHTALPCALPPKKTIKVDVRVAAPRVPKRYQLAITLLQSEVAWFDDIDERNGVRGLVSILDSQ